MRYAKKTRPHIEAGDIWLAVIIYKAWNSLTETPAPVWLLKALADDRVKEPKPGHVDKGGRPTDWAETLETLWTYEVVKLHRRRGHLKYLPGEDAASITADLFECKPDTVRKRINKARPYVTQRGKRAQAYIFSKYEPGDALFES